MDKPKGKGKFANMPTEVVMRQYPEPGYSGDPHLDDTIVRLDMEGKQRKSQLKKYRPNGMY